MKIICWGSFLTPTYLGLILRIFHLVHLGNFILDTVKISSVIVVTVLFLNGGCAIGACDRWYLTSAQPYSDELKMIACDQLLNAYETHDKELVYERADQLLDSSGEKLRGCRSVRTSLILDYRSDKVTLQVKCPNKIRGNKIEGLRLYEITP